MTKKLDLDNLAEEFGIDSNEFDDLSINNIIKIDIDKLNNTTDIVDPDVITSININKANAILDRVILEINNSGMSPRLGEVAGQLISTINQATSQVYTTNFNVEELRLKNKTLELKERELLIKEKLSAIGNGKGGNITNNLIVTDRENLLRLMKENKDEIKLLE